VPVSQSILELEEEGFVSRVPLMRQPVVDTHDQVPFVASVSDSYPQSFNLFMTILHASGKALLTVSISSCRGQRLHPSFPTCPI